MKATYWQRGEALDYVNTTDETIPANTVVEIVSRIGVTGGDIEPGQTGTLHVCGVFELPKTDVTEITMGTAVYSDGTGITATAASNTPAGYAAQAAGADDKTILVKLLG